jgi:phosphatidylinositol glycan class W
MQEFVQQVTGNLGLTVAATIRFFLLTGIEYHDHVTEWGVHWNFFLTIIIINLFVVFVRSSKLAIVYAFSLLIISEIFQ